jgi:uncharacterized membrane protein
MSKLLSIVPLAAGILLMVYGLDATNYVSSNPAPAGGGVWLIVVGVAGILCGGAALFMRRFSGPRHRRQP